MANTYKFKRETKNGSLIINDGTSDGLKKALINAVSNPTSTTAITVVSFYPNNTFGIDLSTETVQIWDGTAYVTVTGAEAICLQLNATVLFKTVGGDTSTPGTTLSGENYVFVNSNGTEGENGAALLAGIISATQKTPNGFGITATNRMTVVVAPGKYDPLTNISLYAPYVDVVSLTGQRDVIITGANTISINSDNVKVVGIDVLAKPFTVSGSFPNAVFINNAGGDNSFCSGAGSNASGTFNFNTGGNNSFGGGGGATASGTFNNNTGGNASFGGKGNSSGEFNNNIGGDESFGGGGGGGGATASGTFNYNTGGNSSFGGGGGTITATARLFYCRITNGTSFPTVTAGGITRYCINGDNTTDNQG